MRDVQIVIEYGEHNHSAYVLDPGIAVIATGKTREQVIKNMVESLQAWFEDERAYVEPANREVVTVSV